MSWRIGASLFWELWPKIEAGIPNPKQRAEFTRDLLRLLLKHDVAPDDLRGQEEEVDRLMDEIDPEL